MAPGLPAQPAERNTAVLAELSHPGFTKCPCVPRGSTGSTLVSFSLRQCNAQHIPLVDIGFDHIPSTALVHCLYPCRADLLLLKQLPFPPHLNAAGQCLSCSGELCLHGAPSRWQSRAQTRLWASKGLSAQHEQSQHGDRPHGVTGIMPDSSLSTLHQHFHADYP